MNIGKFYKYIFYKIYRLAESMVAPWWSEWKASLIISILSFFFILSIVGYYNVFIDKYLRIESLKTSYIVFMIIVLILNYYLFIYKDKWKALVEEFDKLPKKKNKTGSWLVFLFVCFVFANFIYSFYLMSQIDWSQYQ